MKKQLIALLIVVTMATASSFAFSACGGQSSHNTHIYDKQVAEANYLKSAATCTEKAKYYYSCECGEKGKETIEYGQPKGHTYIKQVAVAEYLKTEANCTEKAVYYYSCVCGEKGIQTFQYGKPNGHTFIEQVIEAKYLKTEANCTEKAIYYYSCYCGEKGIQAFEYGEPNGHNFDRCSAETKYLKSPATLNKKAVYYVSCSICEEKYLGNTFEYGEVLQPTEGLSYTLVSKDTEYSVSGIGEANITDIVIPYEYEGKPVTHIFQSAFSECSRIKSVTVPDGVTFIGNYAFEECHGLVSITLPNSIESLGLRAFNNCSNLKFIYYNGTMAQWKTVSKGLMWNGNTGYFTIICIDGNLDKNGA